MTDIVESATAINESIFFRIHPVSRRGFRHDQPSLSSLFGNMILLELSYGFSSQKNGKRSDLFPRKFGRVGWM